MSDTFTIEVEVTTVYYETVQFTFSQETLDKCGYKNKDELLEGIRSGDFEPFDWSEEEHWDSYDSEIKHIYWEEAKHVV
jgi:hypothetical protein|tara:strand:- start:128 stop:364 length:237 start_codon:yes stop_codon:yes gene_type:complete